MRSYLVVKPLARVCEADVRALDAQLQMGGWGQGLTLLDVGAQLVQLQNTFMS